LHQVSAPHRVIIHRADDCRQCGAPLGSVEPDKLQKRQVFEIENGALAAVEHRAPVQYGASVFSRALVFAFVSVTAGRANSGSDARFVRLRHLAGFHSARRPTLLWISSSDASSASNRRFAIQPVIGADETGIRINGVNAWVHVARTDTLTHLASHTHRGQAAFNAIGILNQFKGTLVRDGWFSYKWYQQCKHSLCNAHLLRDLTLYRRGGSRAPRRMDDRAGETADRD
jgi:transposase